MRLILGFLLLGLGNPAHAWTFSPTPICTLEQEGLAMDVTVTFDPASGVYAIHLDRPQGWPPADIFAIRFLGERPLTITTDRHMIDGTRLTVTDRGFGNVLSGLERNERAEAVLGQIVAPFSLTGAAGPVAAFRDCPAVPLA